MTDKQERHDDIHTISQQIQSIKTTDSNLNINEQSDDPTMSKVKNPFASEALNERRRKSLILDDNFLNENLPGKNLPEKILFVIDTVKELNSTPFETRAGNKLSSLNMIKRVVEIFVCAKSNIEPKHEYALMALHSDKAAWISNFTNDRTTFMSSLDKIKEDPLEEEMSIFDLGLIFEMICKKTDMGVNVETAKHVSRVILIYARSQMIPIFTTGSDYYSTLLRNSHFYLDCLYVHEPPSDEACQHIYAKLGTLDANKSSYILEVGRGLAALHTNMAKLIAHPLQRSRQDDLPYTYYDIEKLQDSQTNL